MTDEQIIEMARQVAGMITIHANGEATYSFYEYQLKTFANLIAQHERERIFGELLKMHEIASSRHNYYLNAVLTIRARGEA